jgi:hypothetical protein
MNIHQLSINYIQEQDRILLRINTSAQEELRLWFTRRLTINLLPNVQRIVTQWVASQEAVKSPAISPSATADPQTQQMLAEFKREESLQQSDFKTPYAAQPKAFPLGPEPLLVTEMNITPLPTGQLQMSFTEKLPLPDGSANPKPRGFSVALEQKLVHGFLHLLLQAVGVSQWSVAALAAPQAEPALPGEASSDEGSGSGGSGSSGGSGGRPKYLN